MMKAKIHLGSKVNETTKNNEPKEKTELKLLLKKVMIDSIKNANVPSIIEPSIQSFEILGCEITFLFNSSYLDEFDVHLLTRLAI